MLTEPTTKRAIAFFDGQNLFHAARETFESRWPDYDPTALATAVCARQGWALAETRFYTGVPTPTDNPFWHAFWSEKLRALRGAGVFVYSRPLRYRNKTIRLPDGTEHNVLAGEEKGIDVRIALDVIRLATRDVYDVGLLFSQDQDLSEVGTEIRDIARERNRWIKLASAFPDSPVSRNRRGINGTDWVRIDRATYDACHDPRDYRPPRGTR